MGSAPQLARANGPRKAILDLAPLELVCMNALWRLGKATVRQVQEALAATRPRAYTTIMTIMDRLARKGVVARRKAGRAYLYQPNLTAEQARAHAIEQIVEGFFHGSAQELAAHLGGAPLGGRLHGRRPTGRPENGEGQVATSSLSPTVSEEPVSEVDNSAKPTKILPPPRLDESLL